MDFTPEWYLDRIWAFNFSQNLEEIRLIDFDLTKTFLMTFELGLCGPHLKTTSMWMCRGKYFQLTFFLFIGMQKCSPLGSVDEKALLFVYNISVQKMTSLLQWAKANCQRVSWFLGCMWPFFGCLNCYSCIVYSSSNDSPSNVVNSAEVNLTSNVSDSSSYFRICSESCCPPSTFLPAFWIVPVSFYFLPGSNNFDNQREPQHRPDQRHFFNTLDQFWHCMALYELLWLLKEAGDCMLVLITKICCA